MTSHVSNKELINTLNQALYNHEPEQFVHLLNETISPDAQINMCFPFETIHGPKEYYRKVFTPLIQAIPDLEKRAYILMANEANGAEWVGTGGYYTGTFEQSWLGIPPTGKQVSMRFHEFYRIQEGKVVEIQALLDIPELMIQAESWPMSPSLGREWHVPSPATHDGVMLGQADKGLTQEAFDVVNNMLHGLLKHAEGGAKAMGLESYWHPRCSWYGPSTIGTARGIQGFRKHHQIPFLNAMPDRTTIWENGVLFAENNYVAFTAWPGMSMSLSGDGWLGIAPSGKEITMRSLDFWRCEGSLIRENWVLVDILDAYNQLGVDVFARMRELNQSRFPHLYH